MLNGNTIKGMVWDTHSDVRDEQTYSFVFNGALHSHSSEQSYPFISNNTSNIECINFIDGYKVIGLISIKELNSSIIALYNEDTNFKLFLKLDYTKKDLGIGDTYTSNCKGIKIIKNSTTINECQYKELLYTNCFNWDVNNPVRFEYKLTDSTLNLYFVNGLDQDRFISFNLDDFSLDQDFKIKINPDDCDLTYIDGLDCEKTLWYPLVEQVEIDLESVSGGSKLPGKYNYIFAYSTNKGIPLTPFSGLGQGISLFNLGKDTTEYGVKITVKNVIKDSRYRHYTLVVVESRNGQNVYKQIGTYPISQTTVFDWDNSGSAIGLPILLTQYPFYKYSKSITESNNILFKAGLSEFEKFNLQPLISKVDVDWADSVLKEGDYKNDNNYVSFLRDEVYALGIEIILDNLEKGPVFPLVGRAPELSDLTPITNVDLEKIQVPNWTINNTATVSYSNATPLASLYKSVQEGNDIIFRTGKFGYHESTDRYPNVKEVWGALCGQPIRHFRFPDHKVSTHYTSNNSFGDKVYIHPLGVRVKTNMNNLFDQAVSEGLITLEQRNRIKGWKLVRGNRSGNNSIVAKGLLYDMWEYDRIDKDENFAIFEGGVCSENPTKAYFPNYPFNDLSPDPFLTNEYSWYLDQNERQIQQYPRTQSQKDRFNLKFKNTGKLTFHSPDTHFTNPNLGNQLKIEAVCSGGALGFFNQAEEQALQRILNWKHYDFSIKLAKTIANLQSDPTKEEVQNLATNVGNTVGNVVGSAVSAIPVVGAAVGGIIKSVGGLVGGLVGRKIYENNDWFKFVSSSFYNTIQYQETEKLINIIHSIIKPKQYHYQYQAVGNYNNISTNNVPISNQKLLTSKEYISNGKYVIDGDNINNFNRESSVYLKLNNNLTSLPEGLDNSKIILSNEDSFDEDFIFEVETEIYCYQFTFEDQTSLNQASCSANNCTDYTQPNCGTCLHNETSYIWGELCDKILIDSSKYPSDLQTNPIYTYENIVYLDSNDQIVFNQDFNSSKKRGKIFYNALGEKTIKITHRLIISFIQNQDGWSYRDFEDEECFREIVRDDYSFSDSIPSTSTVNFSNALVGGTNPIIEPCSSHIELEYKKSSAPCQCNIERLTNIASYYGSIKNFIPNQYSVIYNIEWLNTSSGNGKQNVAIFGGDTYIGRFAIKRKHSFFNSNLFQNPEDSEINYSLMGNAANPIYFYDKNPLKRPKASYDVRINFPLPPSIANSTNLVLNLMQNVLFKIEDQISIPKYKLDCSRNTEDPSYLRLFESTSVDGYMYLYNYGIASFICESNINVDLRDKGDTLEQDFYPNQSDLRIWLQEKNVSPAIDNFYIYDRSYSKQPTEEFHYMYDVNYKGDNNKIDHSNRVIYSSQGLEIDDDDYSDPFLINRALDFYDFSKKNGNVTSIDGIEGDKVFVRQEHNSSIFGAYITLNSDQNTVLISSGSIFSNKPVEFATPDLGYFGSQHNVILNTPYGHLTIDAIRGQVFLLGNGGQNLEEISNKGMYSFFKEFLPFQLNRYFDINIDNNFYGVGLAMVYDNRFQTIHLTKLDYAPLVDGIEFRNNKFYLDNKEINLKDPDYFCDLSWTISYSFINQAWFSFQPFTPNFYIEHIDYFESGNDSGIWRHNITNKSYQKFYGKLYPFIVETNTKFDGSYHQAKNVGFQVDVLEYMNKYDKIYKRDLSFNKALVSTDTQSSGELSLINANNNLYLKSQLPKKKEFSTEIELSIKEGIHTFNQFTNIIKYTNIPLFRRVCNSYFEELNIDAITRKRNLMETSPIFGDQIKLRLIQDKESKYQYIFKGSFVNNFVQRRM